MLDHLDQLEGTDVRVCGVQDVGRRSGLDKFVHDLAAQVARVFDLAVKFAVTEGACAAFAKLHIALGVEHFFAPQAPGVFGAFTHRFAALQHDRFEAHLRQRQGGEHAARPKAHHHRALAFFHTKTGRGLARRVPSHVGCGLDVGVLFKLLQQAVFGGCVMQRQVHDVNRQQVGLAGVKAAFEDEKGGDVGSADAQGLGRQLAQCFDGVRRGQPVFVGFGRCIGRAARFNRQSRQGEFEF